MPFELFDPRAWPIHAAMTFAGTPWRCIKVAQVCRAACSLMCRIPAACSVSRQYRGNAPGAYGSPAGAAAECGHKSERLNRANRDSLLNFAYLCARQKPGTFDGDESTI
jgi:hypothetical protein